MNSPANWPAHWPARTSRVARPAALTLLALAGSLTGAPHAASAQGLDRPPPWAERAAGDPASALNEAYRQQQLARRQAERELKKIRRQHFGTIKSTEIRQAGIAELRKYTDPAVYPALVEVFEREGDDVLTGLISHLLDQQRPEADATLAWVVLNSEDADFATLAAGGLKPRLASLGYTPPLVRLAFYDAFRTGNDQTIARAAQAANILDAFEVIPWMVATQVGGASVQTGADDRRGALAWIAIGEQIAFVSDLNPVVGPNAVAFDPELSVITSGVLLRVWDAVVVTYRVDVNNALIDLSSRLGDASTRPLGWDLPAWRRWLATDYATLMKPREQAMRAHADALRAAAEARDAENAGDANPADADPADAESPAEPGAADPNPQPAPDAADAPAQPTSPPPPGGEPAPQQPPR